MKRSIPARLPWSPSATAVPAHPRPPRRPVGNTLYDCPLCGREVRRSVAAGSSRTVLLVADEQGGYYVERGRVQALAAVAFPPGDVPQRYALHRASCRAGEDA